MPLTPKTNVLGRENAAHLLRRAAFGFQKSDIDRFATLTPQQAVGELFSSERTTDLPYPPPPLDPDTGMPWLTVGNGDKDENDLRGFFLRWLEGQMLKPQVDESIRLTYSVRERIVYFLHTHFTTKQDKVQRSRSLYYQNALFRLFAFDKLAPENWAPDPLPIPVEPTQADELALAQNARQIEARVIENLNFKSLAEKICLDQAMLKFLDGDQNIVNRENENYGREFLELYTIGKGLEGTITATVPGDYGTFTEDDVQAAAKVFTGYVLDDQYAIIDDLTGLPRVAFRPNRHDPGVKTFSERFDNTMISGDMDIDDQELRALDEIKQLVDLIFSKEETAKFICRRIYRFYVHGEITEEIDNTIIADMAASFTASGFKLQSLLEELFQSQFFYGDSDGKSKIGGLIKSPLELASETLNGLNIDQPDDQLEPELFYEHMERVKQGISNMGLDFYEPFEVAGYTAYHQFPAFSRSWISTTYLTNRYDFIKQTVSTDDSDYFDVVSYVENTFDDATVSDPRVFVISLCETFLPLSEQLTFDENEPEGDLTLSRLNFFLSTLLNEIPSGGSETPEEAWARYWGQRDGLVKGALQKLFSSILETPEYQLF